MKLNLGCGTVPEPGFVNVDSMEMPGVDTAWDLDVFPWPWEDGSASRIKAWDVFEHVMKPYEFMRECWRVLKPGGVLDLQTVWCKSPNYHRDPGHWRGLDHQSLDYWIPGTFLHGKYGPAYTGGYAEFSLVQPVALDGAMNLRWLLKKPQRGIAGEQGPELVAMRDGVPVTPATS